MFCSTYFVSFSTDIFGEALLERLENLKNVHHDDMLLNLREAILKTLSPQSQKFDGDMKYEIKRNFVVEAPRALKLPVC